MEFDRYGRIKNPGISSTEPVNTYTHVTNSRSTNTFFLWDWINDFVIGIGNFIANSTEVIIGILTWIAIIAGGIVGITLLVDVWSKNSFIVAALITFFGGGILYYVFMIILGIMYWVVSISLVIVRYIFYNVYTLLLVVCLWIGIVCYKGCNNSMTTQNDSVRSTLVTENSVKYRCTARVLNVRREPYTNSPVIGKIYRGDIVEVYDTFEGFAYIKYGNTKAWASINYLVQV